MASKLEVEVEVKSSADKFWEGIRESATLFPKILPEYKSIEILEGDGKSPGTIRLINYSEARTLITFAKEKIEAVDEATKTVSYSVIDGDLIKFYKSFRATLQISGKGDGATVKWEVEFEKANEEVPEPKMVLDFAVKTFNDLDAYLLKA